MKNKIPEILYHGSSTENTEGFLEPRGGDKSLGESRDEFVYATDNPQIAAIHATRDKTSEKRYPHIFIANSVQLSNGNDFTYTILRKKEEYEEKSPRGYLYSFNSDGYSHVAFSEYTKKDRQNLDPNGSYKVKGYKDAMTLGAQYFYVNKGFTKDDVRQFIKDYKKETGENGRFITDPDKIIGMMQSMLDKGIISHWNKELNINPINLKTQKIAVTSTGESFFIERKIDPETLNAKWKKDKPNPNQPFQGDGNLSLSVKHFTNKDKFINKEL